MAIAYYGSNGYTVSVPLNDTQDYDLIIDNGDKLLKVQVKFTSFKKRGIFQASLKSCGGTKGTVYKRVIETNIDILLIVTAEKDIYEIPFKDLNNKATINLGEKYKKYIVKI